MSREQKLSKKIAHTLLAMSIVYSGGMNVLCNTVFAAGKGALMALIKARVWQ